MAVAMASMLRQVDVKYCAISSEVYLSMPLSPSRSGRDNRNKPITVTKYLFKYCLTTSDLKDRFTERKQWDTNWRNCIFKTPFSGNSPPEKATCSQFAMRSECTPRNF